MSPESIAGLILLILGGVVGFLFFRGWRTTRLLMSRGVPVVGKVVSVEPVKPGDRWITTIEYQDHEGTVHTLGWGGHPIRESEVGVVYDPEKPRRSSLQTPPKPRSDRIGEVVLWVMILVSLAVAVAGVLLLVGVLG